MPKEDSFSLISVIMRTFFYYENLLWFLNISSIGWLLCKKHSDVLDAGSKLDISDLLEDKVLMFQRKYYYYLMPVICFIVPTMVPVYCWGETLKNSWFVATMLRYIWSLNVTFLVSN
jgi:stearoyl-CoA desaturase (Delta-9 desaturase)